MGSRNHAIPKPFRWGLAVTDIMDMIRANVRKNEDKREQIRRDFPGCTSIIDDFRAVFGPGVKPLYFSEAGKTMGKEPAFEGTDVDKLIRLDDTQRARIRALRGNA